MLTSPKNPKIQRIVRLQSQARFRRKEQVFVIEGVRLAEEALYAGYQPELVLHTENLSERGHQVIERFQSRGVHIQAVTPHVMKNASDTQSPQGILAVLPISERAIPSELNFILIADGLRDPGNLGTLLRTALAAGVQLVLLPPGTVDPFAPKTVRAAMGAHFHLPVINCSWGDISKLTDPLQIFLANAHAELSYYSVDFSNPLALIIGSEADGTGSEANSLKTTRVKIPMPGYAESLNAAV
ncbi:MAG: RNA methyltransferase, partial [Anaerolineae bacterium]|nr:RNA methyltransferase [Anaerolineae bacterium]